MATLLEQAANVYERERALWNVRQDKMNGMYQITHATVDGTPAYVLAQVSDTDAAIHVLERMRATSAIHSALRYLSEATLPDAIAQEGSKAMDGLDVNAVRAFRAIVNAICLE